MKVRNEIVANPEIKNEKRKSFRKKINPKSLQRVAIIKKTESPKMAQA